MYIVYIKLIRDTCTLWKTYQINQNNVTCSKDMFLLDSAVVNKSLFAMQGI